MQKWVQSHGGRLLRYAKRLVNDDQIAQDLVQETFLRLLKMKREEVEGKLPEWLFHVCRNLAIDHLRRKKPTVSIDDETGPGTQLSSDDNALEQMEGNERVSKMLKEISRLPKEHQEVIRLKFQEGLSYQQISKITGLSATNVGFILSNSVKKIREALGEYLDGKGGGNG
jgi:RNA polymerase sigma-70 factor (ECF subfamily)